MTVLITGAAGFIGMHCAARLLDSGEAVIGVDNLNAYYDVSLKEARLRRLESSGNFRFVKADITDREALNGLFRGRQPIRRVLHLAAQAGVRYSLENPYAYVDANVSGHLAILEACRHCDSLEHLVYASSSSVYGSNAKQPFSIEDRVDTPLSLYAATKKSAELMSWCYSHLYGLPQTGLRFFTVYGPWGRPDMAAFIFTKAIFEDRPIRLFNHGNMRRDFTYIEDIVDGVMSALKRPPQALSNAPPHRLYNLGNHNAEALGDFIAIIEQAVGRKAIKTLEPMQPGDVRETFADIEDSRRDLGFDPKTSIAAGLPRFVDWFRSFYRL
jgi:UDP-glucuronate 4-epimerase